MTEYIDKTEAMRRFKPFGREIPKDIVIGVIASVKEDVVRCKDCKHWKRYDTTIFKGPAFVPCLRSDGMNAFTARDDYCSFGERREE